MSDYIIVELVDGNGIRGWALKKRRWWGGFTFIRQYGDFPFMLPIIVWRSEAAVKDYIEFYLREKRSKELKIVRSYSVKQYDVQDHMGWVECRTWWEEKDRLIRERAERIGREMDALRKYNSLHGIKTPVPPDVYPNPIRILRDIINDYRKLDREIMKSNVI